MLYRSDEHRTLELYRSIHHEKEKMDQNLAELLKVDPKGLPKGE